MRFASSIALLLLWGCNTPSTTSTDETSEAMKEKERAAIEQSYTTVDFNGCYWKISGRDTMVAWLAQTENTITGKLSFDNFEKDGSTGTVHGTIEGDVAKLWYTFMSEGLKSVMEIRLQKKDDTIRRGTGKMDVKGDTSFFAVDQPAGFDDDMAFTKIDCEQVPAKYK